VFCIYLRTNSDLCHLHHKLIGFYNPDEKCLLRGTNWVFKYSRLRFVCEGLTYLPESPVKSFPQRPSALSLFREKRSIPRASFIHLSKSLVDEPSSRFPSGAPNERDAHLKSLFYLSSIVPNWGALPPGSLH